MKTLIICISVCHENTLKIAEAMSEVLNAKIVKPSEVTAELIGKYDLIGFGSGIFFWKHHKSLFNLLKKLPNINKKVFVFSTSGFNFKKIFNRVMKKNLKSKGANVVADFSSPGFNTWAIFKIVGGIAKNRPNNVDIENAKKFAESLKTK